MTKEEKKLYNKEYHETNKEKLKKYNKEYYENNKEKQKEYQKEYNKINYENNKEYNKKYYENNKEKLKDYRVKRKEEKQLYDKLYCEYNKEKLKYYRENNKEYHKEYDKIYYHKKYKNDYLFKLKISVRSLINLSFKRTNNNKKSRTVEILGCSFEFFKDYIEQQFEPWMNWENKGKYNGDFKFGWDIDHIIPQSKAITEQDIIKLNHYTNLRPLCSKINRTIKFSKTKKEERIYKLNIINKILKNNQ